MMVDTRNGHYAACPRSTCDGPCSCSSINKAKQDALDGAALRRLREALPVFDVSISPAGAHICPDSDWMACAVGNTIAEAADKCREALG